jgi:hypothetical protein
MFGFRLLTDRLLNKGFEPSYKMLYVCLFGSERLMTLGERPYVQSCFGYVLEFYVRIIFDRRLMLIYGFLTPFSNSLLYCELL